jgi:CBS-domain-containing membrane protein
MKRTRCVASAWFAGATRVKRTSRRRLVSRPSTLAARHDPCERRVMVKLGMERTHRVADVMSRDVIAIAAGLSVGEAAKRLVDNHVSGAPVMTESGRLIGVVTRGDLLEPRHRQMRATVEDAMTRVIYAVRPHDPLTIAVKLMVEEKIHRAIVIDDHGRLVGIITPMDVLNAIHRAQPADRNAALEYVNLEPT